MRGISKHTTNDEINHDLHLNYQQAKASRLVFKQSPTNLVKITFSSRQELEHAIIQSLWLDTCCYGIQTIAFPNINTLKTYFTLLTTHAVIIFALLARYFPTKFLNMGRRLNLTRRLIFFLLNMHVKTACWQNSPSQKWANLKLTDL